MTYFVGIDGGGSTVRVAIVTTDMTVLAQSEGDTVNPSVVGHAESARRIQDHLRDALQKATVSETQIEGVGIGVAGAQADHSESWLYEVINAVTPSALVVPSSDYEIALVGAHGGRQGVLLLSGTGSIACGISQTGEVVRAGGWGYLIGDEGSGYWLGMYALQAVTWASDGRGLPTQLTKQILKKLGLSTATDLIQWLYRDGGPRTREIAGLAPLVLSSAAIGDAVCIQVVESAVRELTRLCQAVIQRLDIENPEIAFAGGLLVSPNPLSTRLCESLTLPDIPQPLYPPVIGAALLAKQHVDERGRNAS